MDITVTMHLSSHEDDAYRHQFYDTLRLVGRFNSIDGIWRWSTDNMNLFCNSFEKQRLTCTRPSYVNSADLTNFDDENHNRELYTRKGEEEMCSICNDKVIDSIFNATTCFVMIVHTKLR